MQMRYKNLSAYESPCSRLSSGMGSPDICPELCLFTHTRHAQKSTPEGVLKNMEVLLYMGWMEASIL